MRGLAIYLVPACLALLPLAAPADEQTETRELVGYMGSRPAVLMLYSIKRSEGYWHVTGEYVVLATMTRRYLEGERSPQLGVTTLREGNTAILYGRPPTGSLQGTWRDGAFRGARYAPGGQEREKFEFSESFPSMEDYAATVRCEASDGHYASTLGYSAEKGVLTGFEWRSRLAPRNQPCSLAGDAVRQVPMKGGLRLAIGGKGSKCAVTLRDLGEQVRVSAEDCSAFCGPDAYLEPVLVEKRGGSCTLFRPHAGR